MKIEIGNYKIASDGICITLYAKKIKEKGKSVGESFFNIIGHYPTTEQAFNRLLDEKISGSEAVDIVTLLGDIKKYKLEVLEALKNDRST